MNHKKYISLTFSTLSALFLASCAGTESYQQKMARYEPKAFSKNQVPDIKSVDFKFKTSKTIAPKTVSRSLASAPENPNLEIDTKESNPTNKKLYFLTLLNEYESLKSYSHEFIGPTVSLCPNFHTGLLRHNEKMANSSKASSNTKKFSYDATKYNDEIYIAKRPELLLPLSKEEITPRVIDVIKGASAPMNGPAVNELIHKALDIHLSKTYSEIMELCEYGASDNYYIYENLITHIKKNKFEANNNNMNILLKTTLFSNIALMISLDKHKGAIIPGRTIASVSSENKKISYAREVMTRLNVSWAEQYFNYIGESH